MAALSDEQIENAARETLTIVRGLSEGKLRRCPYTKFKPGRIESRPKPIERKPAGFETVGKTLTHFGSGKRATVVSLEGGVFNLHWEEGGKSRTSPENLARDFN